MSLSVVSTCSALLKEGVQKSQMVSFCVKLFGGFFLFAIFFCHRLKIYFIMWQKISIEIFSDAAFEGSNTNRLLVFSLCQKFGLYENRFGDGEKLAEMALDNRIFWQNLRNNLIKNAEKN